MGREKEWRDRFMMGAARLGLSQPEAAAILRDARTIHRWAEEECNGTIQRDETDGKTYRHWGMDNPSAPRAGWRAVCRDRETPAIRRIEAHAKRHGLLAMFQGDPRGCPVTLCRPEDIKDDVNFSGLAVPT